MLWEGAELDPEPHDDVELPRAIQLNTRKAEAHLGWSPRLRFDEALAWTVEWYRTFHSDPKSAWRTTEMQIEQFMSGRDSGEANPKSF
jgi:CDP-glucose 4,6-dehydratase